MICELLHCFSRIYSVNDYDLTFVVGPSFFSFAAGGSVSSMIMLFKNTGKSSR